MLHEKRNAPCLALLKQHFTLKSGRRTGASILQGSLTFNLLNVKVAFEMGLNH